MISATNISCVAVIRGKLIHIKYMLFPFPLLYSHSDPISVVSHIAIPMGNPIKISFKRTFPLE